MIKEMIDKHGCVVFYVKTKHDIITFIKDACVNITFSKMSYTEDEMQIITRYFHDGRGDALVMIDKRNSEYHI